MLKKILIMLILILFLLLVHIIILKNYSKKNDNVLFSNIKYYKELNIKRYKSYGKIHKEKTYEQIVTEVNIGLDKPFYTNTKKITNHNFTVLVNKYNYLDKLYEPKNLTKVDNTKLVRHVADEFIKMKKDASKNNLNIVAISGFRSFEYQDNLYNKYVKVDGLEKADKYSARAGYSEHQTGLAIDISNGKKTYMDFENTKEFNWMQKNSYKYGFILRYPKGKENITGYIYESWHYRYVGIKIALYIKKHNITYDEYYVKFIDLS